MAPFRETGFFTPGREGLSAKTNVSSFGREDRTNLLPWVCSLERWTGRSQYLYAVGHVSRSQPRERLYPPSGVSLVPVRGLKQPHPWGSQQEGYGWMQLSAHLLQLLRIPNSSSLLTGLTVRGQTDVKINSCTAFHSGKSGSTSEVGSAVVRFK